jgi:hypothetical protein
MNLIVDLRKFYTKIKLNKYNIYNTRSYYCQNWLKEQEDIKIKENINNHLNIKEKVFYEQLEIIKKQNEKIIFLLEKQNINLHLNMCNKNTNLDKKLFFNNKT